jgi:hypothetical protein
MRALALNIERKVYLASSPSFEDAEESQTVLYSPILFQMGIATNMSDVLPSLFGPYEQQVETESEQQVEIVV